MKNGHFNNCVTPLDCWCESRRYWIALYVTITVLFGEILGGIISGSLALLSDAIHVAVDSKYIIVSLIVVYLSKHAKNKESLYRKTGAYIGLALLIIGGLLILKESYERFYNPRDITGGLMFTVAFAGLLGNLFVFWLLESVPKAARNITHKFFNAHVLSDLLMSVAVVFSAIVILATEWQIMDPITSTAVAVYMLFHLTPHLYKEIKTGEAECHNHQH